MADVLVPGVLEKFSKTDGEIAKLETEFGMLTITDLESKEQYDKVHDGRMMLVKMRTQGIDTIEKELKAPGIAFNKAVGEEAEKRRAQLKAIEAHLKSEEDKVDAIKEAARQEKIRKGQEKLNERIKKMSVVGGCVDISIIAPLTDEEFEIEFVKAEKIYDEKKREEEIETARLAEEKIAQDAEKERIRLDGIEIQKAKDKLAEDQKKLDDDKKALDLEKTIVEEKKILAETPTPIESAQEKPIWTGDNTPDRDKLIAYMDALLAVPLPQVSEVTAVRLASQLRNTLTQARQLIITY